MSETCICPNCKVEFIIDVHKKGSQYHYCENCRKPASKLGYRKWSVCLFCGKKLLFPRLKGESKPFCNFNHELQYMLNNYKKRNLKTGCAIIE